MDYPHPGVGPYPSQHTDGGLVKVTEEGDEIRHAWYQWVVFVLFFQVGTVFMINKTFFLLLNCFHNCFLSRPSFAICELQQEPIAP